ncbi:SMI1/KNR4 family protein [Alkalihalophilus pseudofirmus]|nr:SMI1/KNR4 family protein [Alkalihalophilus pseudofirmus]WEG18895.1 SMI1/KNR4 family protein [Alkalihalophilus pseudofirmus]
MKHIKIWHEDNDYGKLKPLTDEMVRKAEDDLGIKLPDSYLQLLKQQNGGYLIFNAHPTDVPTSWASNHVQVDHLFGIGIGTEKGILDSSYLIQEWDMPENIVLISGDGHAWIALDYRNTKSEPAVMYIDVEQEQELQLAHDFESFIKGLIDYSEEEVDFPESELSDQEIKDYYTQIDDVIKNGTPKDIDRLLTKVLSTTNELIRYMVEKMRQHEKPKVHFYLLLFLMCCAEGENKGMIEDDYLDAVLQELSTSKNKDVKELALYSLGQLHNRFHT